MAISFKEEMLMSLFGGGTADYSMLEQCNYSFDDILEKAKMFVSLEDMQFNDILLGAIDLYRSNLEDIIENKKAEIETELKYLDDYEESCGGDRETYYKILDYKDRLKTLENLSPYDDIEYFTNYLDTSIFIVDDEIKKYYKEFLAKEIDEENEKIGFVELDLD